MQCRHCSPAEPVSPTSYASVVVIGHQNLWEQVHKLEKQVIPCFSFRCSRCKNVSILNNWRGRFSSQDAYIVHALATLKQLQEFEEGRLFLVGDLRN